MGAFSLHYVVAVLRQGWAEEYPGASEGFG